MQNVVCEVGISVRVCSPDAIALPAALFHKLLKLRQYGVIAPRRPEIFSVCRGLRAGRQGLRRRCAFPGS